MKSTTLVLLGLLLSTHICIGQSVPQGMKYQAVARDEKGQVMANRDLQLKISLYTDPLKKQIDYAEIHKLITSDLGLFSLSVGEGVALKGAFENIPWSTGEVWMEVAIQTDDKADFITISDSKMLSVPYAFHAGTASELIGTPQDGRGVGLPDSLVYWTIIGNKGTNPTRHKIGTRDAVDLVVVTNNIERMRVLTNGDINVIQTLNVGQDLNVTRKLTVGGNVMLNTNGGATDIMGPLKVHNGSDTYLTGLFTVDKNTTLWGDFDLYGFAKFTNPAQSLSPGSGSVVVAGGQGIKGNLNVGGDFNLMGNATLMGLVNITNLTESTSTTTGALVVGGGLGIGKRLNVGGATALLSTLDVTGATKLLSTLDVTGATKLLSSLDVSGITTFLNTTQSLTKDDGAVVMEGGLGIEKNLNVGGASTFGGAVAFGGAVNITDLTQSTSPTTGALIVAGGVGINKRLNVHEGGLFDSTLGVAGITSITNTTQSSSSINGALVVTGGAGIAKNVNVGGDGLVSGLMGVGGLYSNVKMSVVSPASLEYPFSAEVASSTNKMLFNNSGQLYVSSNKSGTSGNTGNFGFYLDGQDQGMVIKLKGSSFPTTSNNYISFWGSGNTVRGAIEGQTLSELYNSFDYIWFQAMSAVDAALGTAMVIVDLIGLDDGDAAIVDGVELIASVAKWTEKSVEFENDIGVAYVSGSADYAEWLKKANPTEKFSFGDVVAVKGGNISKMTDEADHYMVISMAPIVLGNMPIKGKEADYEKVAFLGQVPVKVKGVIHIGDYILPSGLNDGIAVAVSKADMTTRQYQKVIGVAWSDGYSPTSYSMINVAIGLDQNPLVDKLEQQENQISQLKSSLDEIGQYLASKDPGFRMPDLGDEVRKIEQPVQAEGLVTSNQHDAAMAIAETSGMSMTTDRYEELKNTLLKDPVAVTNLLAETRKILDERGVNYRQFPKIEKLLNDPVYFVNTLGQEASTFRN